MRREVAIQGPADFVRHSQDRRFRDLSDGLEAHARALSAHSLGPVRFDWRRAIGRLPEAGGLIRLPDATLDLFAAGGITIARARAHLAGTGCRTTLRRDVVTATGPMITVTGREVLLEGLAFVDPTGSSPVISSSADRLTIRRCRFEDCYQAVVCTAGNDVFLDDCRVISHRITGSIGPVYFSGTHLRCKVVGWDFETTLAVNNAAIYLGANATASLVGNLASGAGNTVDYAAASGSRDAGNLGNVNVR